MSDQTCYFCPRMASYTTPDGREHYCAEHARCIRGHPLDLVPHGRGWVCSCYFRPEVDLSVDMLRGTQRYCLSVQQPWAWLLVHQRWYPGGKDIENRDTNFIGTFRGRVLIHAGKKGDERYFDSKGRADIQAMASDGIPAPEMMPRHLREYGIGAVVGLATITDVLRASPSRWFVGPYGIVLVDAIPLRSPIPLRGEPGLFLAKWAEDLWAKAA